MDRLFKISMCINHIAANECQRCKEYEKRYREANEELAKNNEEITAMRKKMTAMKKKEKEITIMIDNMKKREQDMTAIKEEIEKEMTAKNEELQITKNVLESAFILERTDKIIINQRNKVIKENDVLINELKKEIQRLIMSDKTLCHICFEKKIPVVCIPCGHIYSCRKCTRYLPTPSCSMCRAQISEYQDILWA